MIPKPLWRPIRVTAALLAAVVAWQVWTDVQASQKVRGLDGRCERSGKCDVVVRLAFAPEAFHLTRAQEIGQLVRTEGPRLYLRGVDPAQLKDYARAYWVVGVEQWNPGN